MNQYLGTVRVTGKTTFSVTNETSAQKDVELTRPTGRLTHKCTHGESLFNSTLGKSTVSSTHGSTSYTCKHITHPWTREGNDETDEWDNNTDFLTDDSDADYVSESDDELYIPRWTQTDRILAKTYFKERPINNKVISRFLEDYPSLRTRMNVVLSDIPSRNRISKFSVYIRVWTKSEKTNK